MKNLNELTIKQAYEGLKNKEFSSVDLTKACLERIKERNAEINAFISIFEDSALLEAAKADKMIADGQQQILTGIPFAVKDAIDTLDLRSTGSAKILDNYIPPFEATVISKIRAQGAVLLGKNNCDAFGHGASNENSMYGPVANPHDMSKVAGGSSGGSAAAVADHQCIFSIAEDTGGSIRYPASFCGIVGLRPSYGRNSRYGIMPMASSLDTVGPMAKTVEDIAILMEVIAGTDAKDATTVSDEVPEYSKKLNKKEKFVIGLPKEYFEAEGMEAETRKIVEDKIKKIQEDKNLQVEFKEVSFAYNKTREIIKKMDLVIKPQEKIALVGSSGAGKSTIVKLLLRQHDISGGKILIDGQNIAKCTQESLWQNVSLVPQDPMLFHRSIMENIRYAKPDASDEEVMSVAKQANAHDFILNLSDGYNTLVGERGIKLSGGERQRVAIARAILKNSPILILDEATSSLDSKSEKLIQDALGNLMKGKTVIIVAHRLSTIMNSNRILVIEQGGILEQGSHKVLLKKKNGIYRNLWDIQVGGFMA